jgi:hypothetical protein
VSYLILKIVAFVLFYFIDCVELSSKYVPL